MIELLSILILTFSLTLILLGLVTLWLERGSARWQGVVTTFLGLLVGAGYAFLGSRFSLLLFDRLIIRVNLPALMATAVMYTIGVLAGAGLAISLFLWVTGRYQTWQIRRRVLAFGLVALLLAILLTFVAASISHLPV